MDAAEPFNVPVNPVALGIPVSMHCYIFSANWISFVIAYVCVTTAILLYKSFLHSCQSLRG